eukprot:jgi/Mesvir1/28820/Mv25777-RA.1
MAAVTLRAGGMVRCSTTPLNARRQPDRHYLHVRPTAGGSSVHLELKASFTTGSVRLAVQPRITQVSGRPVLTTRAQDATTFIRQTIAADPVVVFVTSWCPYCTAVKGLFDKMGVKYRNVDVEEIGGIDVRGGLLQLTGQRTVPNVFIDTMALRTAGKLGPMLQAAGVSYKQD